LQVLCHEFKAQALERKGAFSGMPPSVCGSASMRAGLGEKIEGGCLSRLEELNQQRKTF